MSWEELGYRAISSIPPVNVDSPSWWPVVFWALAPLVVLAAHLWAAHSRRRISAPWIRLRPPRMRKARGLDSSQSVKRIRLYWG